MAWVGVGCYGADPMPSSIRPIFTPGAPSPLGAYPHGVAAGGFVFCSGQGARDPETGLEAGVTLDDQGGVVAHDIRVQTEAALRNLGEVLTAAGSSWDRLVEINVYLKDMGEFDEMNAVYNAHFPDGGPARTTIGVADLPRNNFVEIRAVALS